MLRQAAGYGPEQRGGALISTERLGTPGRESSWFERRGYSQRHLVYPNEPDAPTATCHVQPGPGVKALCGFPWERLVSVPGAVALADVPESLRCTKCQQASQTEP